MQGIFFGPNADSNLRNWLPCEDCFEWKPTTQQTIWRVRFRACFDTHPTPAHVGNAGAYPFGKERSSHLSQSYYIALFGGFEHLFWTYSKPSENSFRDPWGLKPTSEKKPWGPCHVRQPRTSTPNDGKGDMDRAELHVILVGGATTRFNWGYGRTCISLYKHAS